MGPDGIERQFIKRAFDSCGRPLDSQVENGGKPVTGEEVFSDGRNRTDFIFTYSCRTTHSSKGDRRRRFVVNVAPGDDGKYYITGFGCHSNMLPTAIGRTV